MRIQRLLKRATAITISAALLTGVAACGSTEPVSNNNNEKTVEQAQVADSDKDVVGNSDDAVVDEPKNEIAFDAEENTPMQSLRAIPPTP